MSRSDAAGPAWAWFALGAIAVGTSYALLPLYSSNQNHHFLIGLARAGDGWLRDDWMAHTVDPFPVFTTLVDAVHRRGADGLFYVIYYVLFGAYAFGLLGIVEHVVPGRPTAAQRLVWLALLCVLHNEVFAYLIGFDPAHVAWWQMTHWGVAGQELFGHGAFQASSFGMLLPLAIRWFLERRPYAATALAGGVLLVHFSYVLIVAGLTAAFMGIELRRTRRVDSPLIVGGTALACALPVLAYVALRLGPTSTDVSTTAAAILVRHLPQETIPAQWFGVRTCVQIALMLGGVWVARRTDLLPILAAPLAIGVVLTVGQVATGSPRLALLFPWRVSVLLVPIATALLLQLAVRRAVTGDLARERRWIRAAAVVVLLSMAAGLVRMTLHFAYFYGATSITSSIDRFLPPRWRDDFARVLEYDALPTMKYVRGTARAGDLYVVPPDLERFRVVAGVPVLVDRKSHPYKDVEVLEWRRRLDLVEAMYASAAPCAELQRIAELHPVTHVVVRAESPTSCAGWTRIRADSAFKVYQRMRSPMLQLPPFDDTSER